MDEPELQDYLKRLGKVTSGKSCVYINRLADVDTAVLTEMIGRVARCDCVFSGKDGEYQMISLLSSYSYFYLRDYK